MNSEMVISFTIGAIVMLIYKLVKFSRECRRRLENYEKSREVSNLILEVLDYPTIVDYAAFFRKETWIYGQMMEVSTDIWKLMTYEQRKKIIKDLSDEYDKKYKRNQK